MYTVKQAHHAQVAPSQDTLAHGASGK